MIYRVNRYEDIVKRLPDIPSGSIVVIDRLPEFECSGVIFKTNKGWSKVFLDSTQLNRDATINGSLTVLEDLTVTGEIISNSLAPVVYTWDNSNDGNSIPANVDVIIVDIGTGDTSLYLPAPYTVGKSFTIVTNAPLGSPNKLYLDASFGALINGDSGSTFVASNSMKQAVGCADGWIIK